MSSILTLPYPTPIGAWKQMFKGIVAHCVKNNFGCWMSFVQSLALKIILIGSPKLFNYARYLPTFVIPSG